ncbi:MAG: DUF1302 family protein [Immundisolibacter sp.]|uniref:DUF1302 family protein n=1 Tax=Immundisolibacter sp. TaxID=1934948 RepID=UPI003EDFEF28
MESQKVRLRRSAVPAALGFFLGSAMLVASPAQAVTFDYSGYIREHLSVNLQNSDEFKPTGDTSGVFLTGEKFGGQGDLSMWRHSGKLEATADFGLFRLSGIGRIARETRTKWNRDLQDASKIGAALATTGAGFAGPPFFLPPGTQLFANGSAFTSPTVNALLGAPGCVQPFCPFADGLVGFGGGTQDDLALEQYDSTELREAFVSFDIGDRTHFKLGKQQVVWGETDFFRAMDIIHGYDLRWRSFLEGENEELRKPLIMGNVIIDIPELAGALQLVFRPGWDNGEDMGETGAINGGRWAPSPWAGNGTTSSLLGAYNYHHNLGDENDANYGFRWSGTLKQIGYSFAYYRGLANDGLVVRNPAVGGATNLGQWEGGNFRLAELIYPMTETYGITLNGYSGVLDSVLRAEVALTPNKAYNTGTNTFVDLFAYLSAANGAAGGGAGNFFPFPVLLNDPNNPLTGYTPDPTLNPFGITTGGTPVGAALSVPGLAGIVEKDTLKIMLGLDKQLGWTMNTLGTSRPSFWTVQLFDTWIMNYDKDDDILELFGFGAPAHAHKTILTNAFSFPYKYDTVTPGFALGVDLGTFDAFMIPSLDIAMGDHWRLRFEADIFLPRKVEKTNLGVTGSDSNDTRLLGTLHDRDQFVARITYQF